MWNINFLIEYGPPTHFKLSRKLTRFGSVTRPLIHNLKISKVTFKRKNKNSFACWTMLWPCVSSEVQCFPGMLPGRMFPGWMLQRSVCSAIRALCKSKLSCMLSCDISSSSSSNYRGACSNRGASHSRTYSRSRSGAE